MLSDNDLGDTLEVRWFGGASGSAAGLQLAGADFTANVVPEPISASMGMLGLGGLLMRRRR